jgi:GNAT superfamily N-acetyltransferase
MSIRPARPDDLPALGDLEVAAGRIFRTVDMDSVAGDDPIPVEELKPYQQDGRAWVYTDDRDRPVGYLLVSMVDGHAHIAQVSVHPDHARRGLGAELIEQAVRWAKARGLTTVSLTTFTEVPWNGPYYARLGFSVLPEDQLTEGLAAIRADEANRGLDRWPRATMVRRI